MTAGGGEPAPVIDVTPSTYETSAISPSTSAASVTFNADGTVSKFADSGSTTPWKTGAEGVGYDIKFETITGTLSSGTANTWLSLDVNQTFGVERLTTGVKTWNGTVRIREAISPFTELDSAAVTIQAVVEPEA